jgi:hypothetical protein
LSRPEEAEHPVPWDWHADGRIHRTRLDLVEYRGGLAGLLEHRAAPLAAWSDGRSSSRMGKETYMKTQSRMTRAFAAAAMTGLVAGAAASITGCQQNKPASEAGVQATGGAQGDAMQAKHDCKGMNNCKGQGGCKSGDNGCKGKNSCKGKGGCNTNHPMEM